jgi:LCP family protein required for cell wall assembly
VFWTGLIVLLLLLAIVGWGAFGFLSFRGGVEEANDRLPLAARNALAVQDGSLLTTGTNVLLIGVDTGGAREGQQGRADALVIIRTDPDTHRVALLAIPRDLRVDIEGYGPDKINAAYAFGGARLAVTTVSKLVPSLPIHHVVVVDFASFPQVIDELGGITVDVPKPILSNKFDCPLESPAACDQWPGWRFAKGPQQMDGRRALVYARIRENALDPSESDVTRGGRQQQVVQAIVNELVGVRGFLRLPFVGGDVVRPLATDLSATELLQLGWVHFRAADSATLRCRLGGQPVTIDGVFYLDAAPENVSVVQMISGATAPQRPQGLFSPGCVVGG